MLKFKVYITIVAIYEMVTILLMHSDRVCRHIFASGFCSDGFVKYFVICVVIPLTLSLLAMWISEGIRQIRRRHSLVYQAGQVLSDVFTDAKHKIQDALSSPEIKKFVLSGLAALVQDYLASLSKQRASASKKPQSSSGAKSSHRQK